MLFARVDRGLCSRAGNPRTLAGCSAEMVPWASSEPSPRGLGCGHLRDARRAEAAGDGRHIPGNLLP